MAEISNWLYRLQDFLGLGGPVLLVLVVVIAIMWILIFERLIYIWTAHRCCAYDELSVFAERSDQQSWQSEKIYDGLISRLQMQLGRGINWIKTLAKVSPLLGLLGTVTGMVSIFTVMGLVGNTAPRAIAGGVSTAIITTMAGMVGALSGLFPAAYLSRQVQMNMRRIRNDPMRVASTPVNGLRRISDLSRISLAMVAGVFVTFALVNVMEAMARFSGEVIVNERVNYKADYIRVDRERRVERVVAKPDRPESPENQPEPANVTPDLLEGSGDQGLRIQVAATEVSTGSLNPNVSLGGFIADGDYLPIVKVEPTFPRAAVSRRLEGWVIVSFTVTSSGSVRDVFVIESSDEVFEQAAMAAARKFRYKPRVSNGQPITVTGVRNRIWFRFADRGNG